jgi:retron-type reverse transcriptase
MKRVRRRVADKDIRDLLWKFLRAGVMYRKEVHETTTGTPQGGIVSPLLANIYLHDLDRYMESNYLDISEYERRKRRRQKKSNFHIPSLLVVMPCALHTTLEIAKCFPHRVSTTYET